MLRLGLPFEPPARLDAIEIAVEIDLQQRRGMISRPTGLLRHNTRKAQRFQVQFVNEDIDDADRIVRRHIVFQTVRQQRRLPPILALNKTLHPAP
jgi:hypothetical protein